jgi:hypothetical protein
VITVLLVLALARSRRGQQCIRAITEATAPMIAILAEALLPIVVELATLAHQIRTLPARWRARHDRHPDR